MEWGEFDPPQLISSSPACPPGAAQLTLVASKKDLPPSGCRSIQLLRAARKPAARLMPNGEDFEYIF